jgi:hypothetical protein
MTAEWVDDRHGPAVMLSQASDDYNESTSVLIHPWQLRAVCEKFGLVASDQTAHKTIATLTRRLHLLNSRIQHLDNWLRTLSDSDHADLTYEIGFSGGTADMAKEFCAELVDTEPQEVSPAPTAKPIPKALTKPTPPQASLI